MDAYEGRLDKRLLEQVSAEIAKREQALAAVKAPDYASYCEKVGFIKGLQESLRILQDVKVAMAAPEIRDADFHENPHIHRRYED